MPGVKKSNDVELQFHESDATDQTEVIVQDKILLWLDLNSLGMSPSHCGCRQGRHPRIYSGVLVARPCFSKVLLLLVKSTSRPFLQDTLVAIRVTLPEKDEDTDEPSPAETLQMAVRPSTCGCVRAARAFSVPTTAEVCLSFDGRSSEVLMALTSQGWVYFVWSLFFVDCTVHCVQVLVLTLH